ncbi:uncharacterized protein LOC113515264 [Galleria mellonella]|uniref:Uncharacterized protein LOC113515264 n=1 Tax=Galleria mellonella TaxID=7137 RepID=A0ABM3N0G2_GALME|nr:uncharacterized protein LOC113515264 [Galleria mellonella]
MISNHQIRYRKVQIHINTFEADLYEKTEENKIMNKDNHNGGKCKNFHNNRTICSICLNTKTYEKDKNEGVNETCPICHQNKGNNNNVITENQQNCDEKGHTVVKPQNTKLVQTPHADISQGLNLLNEVLTVFQSKKQLTTHNANNKAATIKDASTITDVDTKVYKLKPKLSVSNIFHYSIEEHRMASENRNFRIVHCFQPDYIRSQHLIKRKSSSVPQMKLEELKHCLKEKKKSKDTIEEVNRMFATVKRNESNTLDCTNRPIVRNGPRLLSVVKTKDREGVHNEFNNKIDCEHNCKYCKMKHRLSSGDSSNQCRKTCNGGKYDKCVYTLCCHCHTNNQMQNRSHVCECYTNNLSNCRQEAHGDYEDDF